MNLIEEVTEVWNDKKIFGIQYLSTGWTQGFNKQIKQIEITIFI